MNGQLSQYYESKDIAPVEKMSSYDGMFEAFCCKKKNDCREVCLEEYKKLNHTVGGFCFSPPIVGGGVDVSQYYQDGQYKGTCIPRIVVLSLSRPQPDPSSDLLNPPESQASGGDRNQHWPKTLETVRSLLYPVIGYKDDNLIEKLFVHVRTAKCCSNAGGGSNEDKKVYANCGVYLPGELSILKPNVIVTQGGNARRAVQQYAFNAIRSVTVFGLDPCIAHIAELQDDNHSVYWLPMIFPTNRYGHMKTWDKQAGKECNGVRKNLVRYGEEIMRFIDK